jgi:hypothetical protein
MRTGVAGMKRTAYEREMRFLEPPPQVERAMADDGIVLLKY